MKVNVIYVSDPTTNENLDPARIVPGTPVVLNANKPGFASISVEKTVFDLDSGGREGGFASKKRLVHFIGGPVEDLVEFCKMYDLKAGDEFNAKTGLKRDIVVKESTTKWHEGSQPKINPTTEEQFVTEEGEPIYRTTLLIDKSHPDCFNLILKGVSESVLAERMAEAENARTQMSSGVE